jgi:hypothetical protein
METAQIADQALLARELLEKTYRKLSKRNTHFELNFKVPILSEIGDDSDPDRNHVGYIGYKEIGIFNFNDKNWAIGNGKAFGGYPARPYDSDILAVELQSISPVKVLEEFQNVVGSYFKNSLLYAESSGQLACVGRFNEAMMDKLAPNFDRFVAEGPRYNEEIIDPNTHNPAVTSPAKYKSSLADVLAETIEAVLSQS